MKKQPQRMVKDNIKLTYHAYIISIFNEKWIKYFLKNERSSEDVLTYAERSFGDNDDEIRCKNDASIGVNVIHIDKKCKISQSNKTELALHAE